MTKSTIENLRVVSRDEWIEARKAHLANEKALTKARDKLDQERRELPCVKVEKAYVFGTPDGKKSLDDLFNGRSQLIVYHFMFGPGWKEGCVGCSFVADHIDGAIAHLNARDVTLVVVSRAPLPKLEAFKNRMGWRFKWASSHGSDFNNDYHVSFTKDDVAKGNTFYNFEAYQPTGEEAPGLSVFYKNSNGDIFHTYSAYARGLEVLDGAYSYLDLVPKGRDEADLPYPSAWWRHHDRYEER